MQRMNEPIRAAAPPQAAAWMGRRAASLAPLLLVLPGQSALALSDLDMDDSSGPVVSSVGDLDAAEPIKIGVVTLDASGKKPKKDTPANRLKELQAKKDLTDKEKKELRQLKADEMCEMLGRGC